MYRKLNFIAFNMTAIKLFGRLIEARYLKRKREFLYSLISVEQSLRKLIANYALVTKNVLQEPAHPESIKFSFAIIIVQRYKTF